MKKSILNIAAYKFIKLAALDELRAEFKQLGQELDLTGTILLAEEGVNLMFSGLEANVRKLQTVLEQHFGAFVYKESWSESQSFRRWLVKIKKEIIPLRDASIDPVHETAPNLPPETLKQWLDEGRDVVLLDTRNDYETRIGKFHDALDLHVEDFQSFYDKVDAVSDDIKEKTVVAYCTGGIRCEKATAFMQKRGFKDVYQLQDGILGYFEKCGGAHYDGECFVFDARVALDANLDETPTVMCFACQNPLTAAEQQSAAYELGVSCPYCIDRKNKRLEDNGFKQSSAGQ